MKPTEIDTLDDEDFIWTASMARYLEEHDFELQKRAVAEAIHATFGGGK
jgi:hypothetical protein